MRFSIIFLKYMKPAILDTGLRVFKCNSLQTRPQDDCQDCE